MNNQFIQVAIINNKLSNLYKLIEDHDLSSSLSLSLEIKDSLNFIVSDKILILRTLKYLNNCSILHQNYKKYEDAIKLYSYIFKLIFEHFDENSDVTIDASYSYGISLVNTGKYEKGKTLLIFANIKLENKLESLDSQSIESYIVLQKILQLKECLGKSLVHFKKFEDAIIFYNFLVNFYDTPIDPIIKAINPPLIDPLELVDIKYNYAYSLFMIKNYRLSLIYLQHVYSFYSNKFGIDDTNTIKINKLISFCQKKLDV